MADISKTAEGKRLAEARARSAHWKRWGPYLAERAWGTVREDYSASGDAWSYFPHAHARLKAYRWNEDGIAGVSDNHQRLCMAIAVWNGRDPFLKERIYGVTGAEGNHGEDPKEYYFYQDATPTHSYLKYLYKYPQAAFPYEELILQNRRRDKQTAEYELLDTGVFDDDRYFDVQVEYAKADADDVLMRITVTNHGPEAAEISVLPHLWYRNTWSWSHDQPRPRLYHLRGDHSGYLLVGASHPQLGERLFAVEGAPEPLFTENESNFKKLYKDGKNVYPFVKDAFHDYVVKGVREAVNPELTGSKMAAHFALKLAPGESHVLRCRLTDQPVTASPFGPGFDAVFADRIAEADEFYAAALPPTLAGEPRNVARQALAGMIWGKQYYHYVVKDWLDGDPAHPPPPTERKRGRNAHWKHLHNADVISMPDKWEYPWYAAWDLAFHAVPLALIDPDFAKHQLVLMLREWYMHPNGQIPAYEWNYGDVNPPVHAWASWKVYQMDKAATGKGDRRFLERVFHKLLLNFTWWVNRKDAHDNNIFEGGFLGLDNIGVFDRSSPLPTGGFIEQSDGTSWVAMYTLNMLRIALELAQDNDAYEDVASKFFEHFVQIDYAMHHMGDNQKGLWDAEAGFYYDLLNLPDGSQTRLKVRSMVGLIPLFAAETLDPELLARVPRFRSRLEWLLANRKDLVTYCEGLTRTGKDGRLLLSLVDPAQLRQVLGYMLDPREFLSDYGIRSLSKAHEAEPYTFSQGRHTYRVDYDPADSTSGMFGGNSNWRGPIWFPVNYMLVESLRTLHAYLGEDFKVECPVGSGHHVDLQQASEVVAARLTRIFLPRADGRRPVYDEWRKFSDDPRWRDNVLFYEYFHGDTGRGVGASHQTGWTGLVANLLVELAEAGNPAVQEIESVKA